MPDTLRPRYDSTITLGHMLTFMGFLLAGLASYYGLKEGNSVIHVELNNIERRLTGVEIEMRTLSKNNETVVSFIARTETLVKSLEKQQDISTKSIHDLSIRVGQIENHIRKDLSK